MRASSVVKRQSTRTMSRLRWSRHQFDTVLLSRHDPSPCIQFAKAGRIHQLCLNSMTFNY